MVRKAFLAVLFLLPAAVLVLQDYWPFLRPHLPGGAPQCLTGPAGPQRRPWATPVPEPALRNFYRVSDQLYRGAQPDANAVRRLKAMGIRTVVSLRHLHDEQELLAGAGLDYEHIPVNPFKPTSADLVRFLRVVTDPNRTPVYVHCQRGIDRTGMMCAVYRMTVCGWSKDEAIAEMQFGPFGYDGIFRNVGEFLRGVDVDALSRRAGIKR